MSAHSTLKLALLAAIPLEAINFWVVGYPAGTHTLSRASQIAAVALQWYVVHLPGVIFTDRVQFLRVHPLPCSLVLLLAGYIDTAILLTLLLLIARLAQRTLRKLSSSQAPAS